MEMLLAGARRRIESFNLGRNIAAGTEKSELGTVQRDMLLDKC